jgi:hypothetical protein
MEYIKSEVGQCLVDLIDEKFLPFVPQRVARSISPLIARVTSTTSLPYGYIP